MHGFIFFALLPTFQFLYYSFVVLSLGMNLSCVSSTTALSVFGTGLALRGPDGSMVICRFVFFNDYIRLY